MPTYGMGAAIREMRIRSGYTQEELSYGICTAGTLSRIENGKAIVSKQVFEALCERMPGLYYEGVSYDTKQEMQRSKLGKQILIYLENRRMQQAKVAMKEYHRLRDSENPFCKQFELYTQAIYQAILKEREEEILPKLEQALEITMPNYEERFGIPKKPVLFTYDELYIVSNIGLALAKGQETEKAFQILYYLKSYMEKQEINIVELIKVYPMILGNLAWILERQGRFKEAVKQCDAGIEVCKMTGKYNVLPYLLCIKAWCFTASGNLRIAKKCRQQAKMILDITEQYRGYGSFTEFYKSKEPIFVTF